MFDDKTKILKDFKIKNIICGEFYCIELKIKDWEGRIYDENHVVDDEMLDVIENRIKIFRQQKDD